MNETIEFKYSPEFARKLSREYIWRTMRVPLLLSAILGIIGIVALLTGINNFLVGVIITISVLYIGKVASYERNVVAYAKSQPNQLITVAFDDDGMTYQGVDFISIVKWRKFQKVTTLKNAWLFSTDSANNYAAIPSALITDTIKTFVQEKMTENHKPIK